MILPDVPKSLAFLDVMDRDGVADWAEEVVRHNLRPTLHVPGRDVVMNFYWSVVGMGTIRTFFDTDLVLDEEGKVLVTPPPQIRDLDTLMVFDAVLVRRGQDFGGLSNLSPFFCALLTLHDSKSMEVQLEPTPASVPVVTVCRTNGYDIDGKGLDLKVNL